MSDTPGPGDFLKAWLQYPLPHHALSRLVHATSRSRAPWLRDRLMTWFVERYGVDLKEADRDEISDYDSLNDLFTRALNPGARPVDHHADLVSPVDGVISRLGDIERGQLIQAKGRRFTLEELLADEGSAEPWKDGRFITLYLAPHHYHRVHMPADGTLVKLCHVPGRLFSVNPATTRGVPRLFARNERLVAGFETEFGPMAVILVGAMLVGSMETIWTGEVTPPTRLAARALDLPSIKQRRLGQGAELGRFNMGSTVIVVLPAGAPDFARTLHPGRELRMGMALSE